MSTEAFVHLRARSPYSLLEGATRIPELAELCRSKGMEALKKAEKDNLMSEDEHKRNSDLVQKATDNNIAAIDELLKSKQDEITQV